MNIADSVRGCCREDIKLQSDRPVHEIDSLYSPSYSKQNSKIIYSEFNLTDQNISLFYISGSGYEVAAAYFY